MSHLFMIQLHKYESVKPFNLKKKKTSQTQFLTEKDGNKDKASTCSSLHMSVLQIE